MKLIKDMTLILSLLTIPLLANAQDRVGNGGDVLVCPGQKMIMLDTYELSTNGEELGFDPTTQDPFTKVERKMAELSKVSKLRGARYLEWLSSFPREAQFRPGIELPDIDDEGLVVIPRGCKLEQIAVQAKSEDVPVLGYRYIINKDLWDQLDPDNQAVLLMHELVYREQLTANPKVLSSLRVRMMTRALISKDFNLETYFHVQSNSSVMFLENEWFWGEVEPNLGTTSSSSGFIDRSQVRLWRGFRFISQELWSEGEEPNCWRLHKSLWDYSGEQLTLFKGGDGRIMQIGSRIGTKEIPTYNSLLVCPDKQRLQSLVKQRKFELEASPAFDSIDFGDGGWGFKFAEVKKNDFKLTSHVSYGPSLQIIGKNSDLYASPERIQANGNLMLYWRGELIGETQHIKASTVPLLDNGVIDVLRPPLKPLLLKEEQRVLQREPSCSNVINSGAEKLTLRCDNPGLSFKRLLSNGTSMQIEIQFQDWVVLIFDKSSQGNRICGEVAPNTIIDYRLDGTQVVPVYKSGSFCYSFGQNEVR